MDWTRYYLWHKCYDIKSWILSIIYNVKLIKVGILNPDKIEILFKLFKMKLLYEVRFKQNLIEYCLFEYLNISYIYVYNCYIMAYCLTINQMYSTSI